MSKTTPIYDKFTKYFVLMCTLVNVLKIVFWRQGAERETTRAQPGGYKVQTAQRGERTRTGQWERDVVKYNLRKWWFQMGLGGNQSSGWARGMKGNGGRERKGIQAPRCVVLSLRCVAFLSSRLFPLLL